MAGDICPDCNGQVPIMRCSNCRETGIELADCENCRGCGWLDDPSDGGTMNCDDCDGTGKDVDSE